MPDSFFLGPHAENAEFFQKIWAELWQRTQQHRRDTFAADGLLHIEPPDTEEFATMEREISNFFAVLHKEVPTFSNRYLGHMVSDISIPALIGNIAVMFCNPNLASKEVAEAGVLFETQAINQLAEMFGFELSPVRGHFTSGGTMANFEALWRARYRLDHWLSLAAYMLEHDQTREDIFSLAHMGWNDFQRQKDHFGISMQALRERSYVLRGPWDIAHYFRDALNMDFPQPVILVPGNKHYSWPKSANVFGISEHAIWSTELDRNGRVCVNALAASIERAREERRPIMMVVSVAGTTELGTVDPIDGVNELLDYYREEQGLHIWHHVDAAYGGYFCSTFRGGRSELAEQTVAAFADIRRADSVTIDPHKLGFVPYACGAFLVREARSYAVSHIAAPYLDEEEDIDYPTWSTTLEGSRSATGAGAVWLSSRVLPLNVCGHGALINQALRAKAHFTHKLAERVDGIHFMPGSDTNILCFVVAPDGNTVSQVNRLTESLLQHLAESPHFAVSHTSLSLDNYRQLIGSVVSEWQGDTDEEHLLVIRMVIMSPYLRDTETYEALTDEFIVELNAYLETGAH